MTLVALIRDPALVERLLRHLGLKGWCRCLERDMRRRYRGRPTLSPRAQASADEVAPHTN